MSMSLTDAAGAAANDVAPNPPQPMAMDATSLQPTPTGGTPAAPATPAKPSLWKNVLAGALNGLAGSAGSSSFGGGLAKGAGAELGAEGVKKAQANQDQKDMDAHEMAQAQVANAKVNMVHTMWLTKSLNPADKDNIRKSWMDQSDAMIKSGALQAAGQAGDHDAVLAEMEKLQKNDPAGLYVPVEVPGPNGLTWQAFKATNAPTQADVDVKMPDGSTRTIPKGSATGAQVTGVSLNNIKTEAEGMVKKAAAAAKPNNTMKVVPDKNSKTGFSYASPDEETGKLTNIRGEAPAPSAQQFSQTKTATMLGPDGYAHTYGFNPQTKRYDVDQGFSASGAAGHQASQAAAVVNAGEDLIKTLQTNKAKLGTLQTWVEKNGLNTPIADPDLAGLQSQLASFAALQPALHGFRSHSALETFEKVIGGLQNNPDATVNSIRGIMKTASNLNPAMRTGKVTLVSPDGKTTKQVSALEADHYIKMGAHVKESN